MTVAAVDDAGTAAQFEMLAHRVRTARILVVVSPVVATLLAGLLLSGSVGTAVQGLACAAGASVCAWSFWWSAVLVGRFGRWVGSARLLLANEQWRPVPAKVLTWDRSPVLELDGLGCVRIVRTDLAFPRAIALTGEVEVVGPDPGGWAAVRGAGVLGAVPARLTEPVPAQPQPTAAAGTVVNPVTADFAAGLRHSMRLLVGKTVGFAVFGLLLVATAIPADDVILVVDGACFVVFGVLRTARNFRVTRAIMRLPAQLAAAPLTAHAAQLDPWTAPKGWATATGRLRTADGEDLPFVLPLASYDLLAAVSATGTLHVAGTPRPGAELAVGVPRRPVLGFVRFSAAATRK